MQWKSGLTLTSLLLVSISTTLPALAHHRPDHRGPEISELVPRNGTRNVCDKAHQELEMRLKKEMSTNLKYRNLSPSEKERMLKEACQKNQKNQKNS